MREKSTSSVARRNSSVVYALEMLGAKSRVLKALLDYRVVQIKALHDAGKYDPTTYGWIEGRISVVSGRLTELYDEMDNLEKELKNHGTSNNQ